MDTQLVLDAWGLIDSEIPANSDWLTEQFALLMHVITLNFGLRNPNLYLIACHTTST